MKLKTISIPFTVYQVFTNSDLNLHFCFNSTMSKINNDKLDTMSRNPNEYISLVNEKKSNSFNLLPIMLTTFKDNKALMSREAISTVIDSKCRSYNVSDSCFNPNDKTLGHHKEINELNSDSFLEQSVNFILNYTSDYIYVINSSNIPKRIPPINVKNNAVYQEYHNKIIILTVYNLVNPYLEYSDLNRENYITRIRTKYQNFTNAIEEEIFNVCDSVFRSAENLYNQTNEIKKYNNKNYIDSIFKIVKVCTYGIMDGHLLNSPNVDAVYIKNKFLYITKDRDIELHNNPIVTSMYENIREDNLNKLLESMVDFYIVDNKDRLSENKYVYFINGAKKIPKIKNEMLEDGFYINYKSDNYKKTFVKLEDIDKCSFIFNSAEEAEKPRDIETLKKQIEIELLHKKSDNEKIKHELEKEKIKNNIELEEKLNELKLKELEYKTMEQYYKQRIARLNSFYDEEKMLRNELLDRMKFKRSLMEEMIKYVPLIILGGIAGYNIYKKLFKTP